MNLYRVVISFMREHMQYMSERGVLAMTPGQALDETLSHLRIDHSKIHSFKSWTEKPDKLDAFSYDAQNLACLGSTRTVREIWTKRFGEII
jgi:hypothetical protein